ncbi:hypothetical protein P873_11035 [Arenimonas composti TR7-09 = DSM 18010]|uniref:Uncharacterized protein n=1 Tax=Arenimonas composti TR7-09 = DSM 18010 TaxID=1121013 RepID=A0A091BFD1_9GAMM|nr:hypothetical protein P873_11035 [Arenimonas composti TR7-09 = DSM 18010]
MALAGELIHLSASLQLDVILASVANGRGHEAQRAVQVLVVVPVYELRGPRLCTLQIGEALDREARTVLGGAEQAFPDSISCTSWPTILRLYKSRIRYR